MCGLTAHVVERGSGLELAVDLPDKVSMLSPILPSLSELGRLGEGQRLCAHGFADTVGQITSVDRALLAVGPESNVVVVIAGMWVVMVRRRFADTFRRRFGVIP